MQSGSSLLVQISCRSLAHNPSQTFHCTRLSNTRFFLESTFMENQQIVLGIELEELRTICLNF